MIVRDRSMEPTLRPGDRLYLDPAPARAGRLARGDIVVLRDPTRSVERLVKRVTGIPGDPIPPNGPTIPPARLYVEGDAGEGSRDSSVFGAVDLREVEGVVWFRYAPTERRGPIGPTLK